MTLALVVLTNGRRDCIDRSVDSALTNLRGMHIDQIVISDDSGDSTYHQWLTERFGDPRITFVGSDANTGYARAVRRAWKAALATNCDLIFWLEEDFILHTPVDLAAMAGVLLSHQRLTQLMLKRQPWFANEIHAGGVIEAAPRNFRSRTDGTHHWVEYRAYWSNPHLVERTFLADHEWPDMPHSESVFSMRVSAEGYRGAFWGRRGDPPLVEHVGIRSGHGY